MQAQFSAQTLAEIFRDLYVQERSGVLVLARGDLDKRVHFERGMILYAESSVQEERLAADPGHHHRSPALHDAAGDPFADPVAGAGVRAATYGPHSVDRARRRDENRSGDTSRRFLASRSPGRPEPPVLQRGR